MVLLPVGVAPSVTAGGAAQPDPPDGVGRRLLLLLKRLLLRLASNVCRHVALGEVTRVGGLLRHDIIEMQRLIRPS